LFVTLFCPAAPLTLDYSSSILYSNLFNGGAWSNCGDGVYGGNTLVGGANTTWVDVLGTNLPGGGMMASGSPGTLRADSWLLPFTPHSGYVYTVTASVTFTGNPGNWVSLGFTQIVPTNAAGARFTDAPNTAYDWMIT